GTRVAGFVLKVLSSDAKWTPNKYQLERTDAETTSPRPDASGHTGSAASNPNASTEAPQHCARCGKGVEAGALSECAIDGIALLLHDQCISEFDPANHDQECENVSSQREGDDVPPGKEMTF